MSPRRSAIAALLLALGRTATQATEPLPDWDAAAATVVVFNPAFPESESLARYYAARRGITADRVVGLKCSSEETITREGFNEQLRDPLQKIFTQRHWWQAGSRMFILVLMRGVPSRVSRQHEKPRTSQEDEASVDSDLCLLGVPDVKLAGAHPNPYFGKKVRFNALPNASGLLLVGRLDAASPATVRRMIDDACTVEATGLRGRAVIDLALKKGAYDEGDEWLRRSVQTYRARGIPVFVDRYEPVLREDWPLPDTALYFGWYTGQIAGALKSPSFQFKRGAVACHLHSFSASTIRTTDQAWVGPILEHGAAATMGNVWEPYLSLTIHFDLLNERLLEGYTLAEAAWNATPGLSWQNVVLGDPLYRPFWYTSLSHEADADADYILYQTLVQRHAGDPTTKALKEDLVEEARKHHSARLLELLGLLSSLEGKIGEAVEVLDHAAVMSTAPDDRLRLILYQVELLRREHDKVRETEALALLKRTQADASLSHATGFGLVAAMMRDP